MLKKWKDKLIEDCRYWWKLWSSWLAILWGLVVTVLWNDPMMLMTFANQLPPEVRAMVSPLVWLAVSGLPIIVRLLKQKKLEKSNDKAG